MEKCGSLKIGPHDVNSWQIFLRELPSIWGDVPLAPELNSQKPLQSWRIHQGLIICDWQVFSQEASWPKRNWVKALWLFPLLNYGLDRGDFSTNNSLCFNGKWLLKSNELLRFLSGMICCVIILCDFFLTCLSHPQGIGSGLWCDGSSPEELPQLCSKPLLFGCIFIGLWFWAHKLASEAPFPLGKIELMITNKMASVLNAQCAARALGPQPVLLLPCKLTGTMVLPTIQGFGSLSAHFRAEWWPTGSSDD